MDEPIRVDTPTRVIGACDYPQIYRPKYFTATEQMVHWHNALRELEFELWKSSLNRAIGNPVEEVLIQRMLDQIAAIENLCKQVMGGGDTAEPKSSDPKEPEFNEWKYDSETDHPQSKPLNYHE